jgi:hypothetical protein
MGNDSQLPIAFESYLRSGLDREHAKRLATDLQTAGLFDEAGALLSHYRGPHSSYVCQHGPWRGRKCEVGEKLPDETREGALWFDTVELVFMVFVRQLEGHSTDARCWISLRPVTVWQFLSFLTIAKPLTQLGADRFAPDRFSELNPLGEMRDLYPDEADAYSAWFGKTCAGEADLESAHPLLSLEQKTMLCPDGLLLWSPSYVNSGWYNRAGYHPQTGAIVLEPFSDCDRDKSVGFATCVLEVFGLTKPDGMQCKFEGESSSPRSSRISRSV